MHHFVPDFDTDDDYVNKNPNSSSSLNLPRKSFMEEDDNLMELLWQSGQVIVQNQIVNNHTKKPSSSSSPPSKLQAAPPPPCSSMNQQPPSDQNLFIQEDEMSSWLHYPLRDDDFCSDLLFSSASPTVTRPPPPPPPPPPVRRNFMNFSRLRGDFTASGRGESGPLVSKAIVRESTQVSPSAATASSSTAAAVAESGLARRTTVNCGGLSSAVAEGSPCYLAVTGHNLKGKAVATTAPAIEIPGSSSSVASKNQTKPVNIQPETNVDERKRKEREATEETECPSSEETNKQGRGLTTSSTKRSRAAEVHNLSERKRRDRINERMKALQELIPRCNKSDKASMLDEAIEYMKSLQLQIQMMSMGCGMMPMMYGGMQQYMPHMAMGMGMNQPIPPPAAFMPYPNMLAAQRPLPPTQTQMGSSGPHYPVHASDPSRVFVPNQQCDPTLTQPHQYPGYMDPYHQQFRSVHPSQPPQFQNQATSYPTSSRVSSSKEPEDHQGNHPTGT